MSGSPESRYTVRRYDVGGRVSDAADRTLVADFHTTEALDAFLRIDALQAENERMEAALRDIRSYAVMQRQIDEGKDFSPDWQQAVIEDFEAALAALSESSVARRSSRRN